jgi:hypothetical protein
MCCRAWHKLRQLDIRLAQDLCEARKDRCRSSFAISEKADREVRLSRTAVPVRTVVSANRLKTQPLSKCPVSKYKGYAPQPIRRIQQSSELVLN